VPGSPQFRLCIAKRFPYAFASAVLIVAATLILIGDPGDPALAAALVEGGVLLAAGLAVLLSGGLRTTPGADAQRVRTG